MFRLKRPTWKKMEIRSCLIFRIQMLGFAQPMIYPIAELVDIQSRDNAEKILIHL